ncbi:MAG: lysylphosphatidylglycerol synthase domain-containing protein [Synechococcales bacterium]|nr:lysylphosphatidylglycerol synthase domain-containing protein [Synechococcales bacterium]
MSLVKQLGSRLKPYLRWVILGGTLFFLVGALRRHWQEVTAIRIDATGWGYLAIALLVTLLAHVWSGWVWSWILRDLGQAASGAWSTRTYLRTNIAKYLPGNVWHFYGRVMAAKGVGIPVTEATVSVVLEALLMAIAALLVAFLSARQLNWGLQILGLAVGLAIVHPRLLNPLLWKLSQAKSKLKGSKDGSRNDVGAIALSPTDAARLHRYPLRPLVGELGFLGLRGLGFLLVMGAIAPVPLAHVPMIFSAFSLAWMLGLVVPGAPGGIGVFEATALALLGDAVPAGVLISTVTFYRLISTLAEALGAGLAWAWEQVGGDRPNTSSGS